MKYCASCKRQYPDTSRFCESCGNQLGEEPVLWTVPAGCPSCGATVEIGWRFCKHCGQSFDGGTAPRASTSSVPLTQTTDSAAAAALPPPASSPLNAATPRIAAGQQRGECRLCGHRGRPDAETCEVCGTRLGLQSRRRRARRIAIVAAITLGIAVLAIGAAVGGWYALGIRVAIQTDPGDSKIVIDGQEVGTTNSYGFLVTPRIRAGDHSLAVMRDGYNEWRQSFTVALTDLSKNLNVKLDLTKYRLSVVSSPSGSQVLVDGNPMGKTSDASGNLETAPLGPGEHTVVVRHDGYRDWKQTVKLDRDWKLEANLTSAPVYDASSNSADSEIRNTLEGWAQATRNRDVDAHLRYYADTLDYYYSRTLVPSSKVREDRQRAFSKFNYLSVQLTNMSVQIDSTGQRATVVFDKTFDFRGDNNASYNGSVRDQVTVTKLGGAWLITGEKELNVYYVHK